MAKNLSGKPNTRNYLLGRGAVYVSALDASTGLPRDYRHLGNAPSFSITVEEETLEHQSSLQGLRVTDARVVLSKEVQFSFALDEIEDNNLELFLSGSSSTPANPTPSAETEFNFIPVAGGSEPGVVLGRWYDLKDAAGARAYDFQAAGDITLKEGSTPATTTLVEDTDYELDLVNGRVLFLSTATNVAAGEGVTLEWAMNASAASTVEQIDALGGSNTQKYAVKFISINPQDNNRNTEYEFAKASLSADGELGLISDEFAEMGFSGVAESSTERGFTLQVTSIAFADL